MATWVNFKNLREQLNFATVLRHYGVEIKAKGEQHQGFCPLPLHNGKRNSPSFSANLARGIFQCFGCGAKGNLLEFAAMMEKVDPNDGTGLRKVALGLQERFCPELRRNPEAKRKARPKETAETGPAKIVAAMINPPLDFELKGLDPAHAYPLSRGFTRETIAHFGLGFCSRGLLKERLALPLHNQKGRLIGYAGRVVDDTKVSEDNPRYRFPGKREREGKVFEFRKTQFLYNGFRIKTPVDNVIAVEGFTSVWWLHQNGLPHVVATMGADCSEKQAELVASLVKPDGHVWLMADGDAAGERFAQSFLIRVSPHRVVRWVKLGKDRQPTDLSGEELKALFSFHSDP